MTLTKAPSVATKSKVTAAPGKTVKRAAKKPAASKAGKPAAASKNGAAAKPAAAAKDSPAAAARVQAEQTRREAAAAKIRAAAEVAGVQKARMGLFIERLQARMDRAKERVEKLVSNERARQAGLLEKHPELKQLNGKVDLDAAAKIPDVEIPESELPGYITSIKLETE